MVCLVTKCPFVFCTGHTPLHLAATCGNPECLRRLVKGKADVDVQVSTLECTLYCMYDKTIYDPTGQQVWQDRSPLPYRERRPATNRIPSH